MLSLVCVFVAVTEDISFSRKRILINKCRYLFWEIALLPCRHSSGSRKAIIVQL